MRIDTINRTIGNALRTINSLFPKIDLSIKFHPKAVFLTNVFKTDHQRKVLVSYISAPFIHGQKSVHTNYIECYFAAQIFNELGFCVDVIDFNSEYIPDYSKYGVIYGFGTPYEKSFYDPSFTGIRIIYSPGCNTVYSNIVSSLRLKSARKKLGYFPARLSRVTNDAWPLQKYLSDAIICLGNAFVADTYGKENLEMPIYSLDLFHLKPDTEIDLSDKDFGAAKFHLIWFGSQGSIHKGLDIALEIIEKNSGLTLHVCGYDQKNEPEILTLYKTIFDGGRAINHGFVDINSPKFKDLMLQCGAVIFPSTSEGGAASIITLMANGGLVPVITKQCGLTLNNLAFEAEKATVEDLDAQVQQYLLMDTVALKKRATELQQYAQSVHSYPLYQSNLRSIIGKILAG
jgi:glycosyltransferase involved in cell wall biosynthesis